MAGKSQSPGTIDAAASGNVVKLSPFQRALRQMELEATADVEDSTFRGDDLNAILDAESDADLWAAGEQGPLNAQHLAGCELQLIDLTVKFSRGTTSIDTPFVAENGKKMYFLATAARISDAGGAPHIKLPAIGEEFQFNTSARQLSAKLWAFYVRGAYGGGSGKTMEALIFEVPLEDGQATYKLREIPKRASRAETGE